MLPLYYTVVSVGHASNHRNVYLSVAKIFILSQAFVDVFNRYLSNDDEDGPARNVSIEESPHKQEANMGETHKQTVPCDECYEHVREGHDLRITSKT